jgi:cell wall-associated NlpC family hydrolase
MRRGRSITKGVDCSGFTWYVYNEATCMRRFNRPESLSQVSTRSTTANTTRERAGSFEPPPGKICRDGAARR